MEQKANAPNVSRFVRHRRGVVARLDELKAEVRDLRMTVCKALAVETLPEKSKDDDR
jgi:hypothetical protein